MSKVRCDNDDDGDDCDDDNPNPNLICVYTVAQTCTMEYFGEIW